MDIEKATRSAHCPRSWLLRKSPPLCEPVKRTALAPKRMNSSTSSLICSWLSVDLLRASVFWRPRVAISPNSLRLAAGTGTELGAVDGGETGYRCRLLLILCFE